MRNFWSEVLRNISRRGYPWEKQMNHILEIHQGMNDRSYWECDCGASGSAPTDRVDLAAEKHVKEGEPVSYRYPAR